MVGFRWMLRLIYLCGYVRRTANKPVQQRSLARHEESSDGGQTLNTPLSAMHARLPPSPALDHALNGKPVKQEGLLETTSRTTACILSSRT